MQCVTRSLFQFSRREREFLSFNLMFETGTRISLFQSHVRDGNENFFFSISCFETRTRISFFNLGLRDENENRDWDNSRENFWELHFLLFYWLIFSKKGCVFLKISWNNMSFFLEKFEWKSHFPRREREYFLSISCFETRTGIFFHQSHVSRREREIENDFSRSSGKKLSWFSREFPGTGIPVTLWSWSTRKSLKLSIETFLKLPYQKF